MTKLDEIQARADLAQGAWEDFQLGIATTRFALDEANNSAEDVPALVAALKAVEAVHTQELGGTPDGSPADICGCCPSYWPCLTIAAIREALGS